MHLAKLTKGSLIRQVLVVLFGLLIVFTGGCAERRQPNSEAIAGAGEFVDSTGYVLKMQQKPQKIVALSIGTAEILIGLVTPSRIAALTYLADDSGISNVSEQAKAVSRKIRANAESVIALQSDLVIISDWQPAELIQTLREAGVPVYVYKTPSTIEEVKQAIANIAQVVGEEQTGVRLVADMDKQLGEITEKVRQIPVDKQQVVIRYSLMGDSGGKGSSFDDLCRYAGVVNGAAAAGLGMNDTLSKEQIVGVNPDVILLPIWDYTGKTDIQKFGVEVQADQALQTVKAIRQHNLVPVSDRHMACTSQYIVNGVKDIAKAAYPQVFKDE